MAGFLFLVCYVLRLRLCFTNILSLLQKYTSVIKTWFDVPSSFETKFLKLELDIEVIRPTICTLVIFFVLKSLQF